MAFFMSKRWTVRPESWIFRSECFLDSLLHIDILRNFKRLLVVSSNGEYLQKCSRVSSSLLSCLAPAVFNGSLVPLGATQSCCVDAKPRKHGQEMERWRFAEQASSAKVTT